MAKTKIDMEEVQRSFDRTDKIIAFRKELSRLINNHGIDNLLNVPDYILATVAVGQMEICSSIAGGIANGHFKGVMMI